MKSRRPFVALAVLLAGALLFAWWSSGRTPPGGDPVSPAGGNTGTASATAEPPPPAAVPEAPRAAALDPNAPVFTVRGHVLADRRAALTGAEVVAYVGSAGDHSGFLSMMTGMGNGARRGGSLPFTNLSEAVARVPVAADGAFELQANHQHLRLSLEHDLYGLALPEIVHVPSASRAADVVLAPYLGGHLRGRLLGAEPKLVQGVRLLTQPDPMGVLRDSRAFLGSIARGALPATRPGADGSFAFRAVPAGAALTLLASGDEVAGRAQQPALEPGEIRDVALPIRRALQLSVRVLDEQDQPVAEARIAALAGAEEPIDAMAREVGAIRGKSAADGTATLRGLVEGPVRVRATADGYLSASDEITLPQVAPLLLRLDRGAAVRGVVVDPQGKPVATAKVASMPAMEVPMLGDLATQMGLDALADVARDGVPTDAAGRFELTGMDTDAKLTVVAAHPDFTAGVARGVRSGDLDVRVELAPATTLVARIVAAEDGTPLPAFTVELRTTMFALLERPVRTEIVGDAVDGIVRLTGLPPGEFTLAARAPERGEASMSVTLAAVETPPTHELRLPRAASVSGRVVDAQGQGIGGAMVQRSRGGIRDNPMLAMVIGGDGSVRCDAQGAFRLDGLLPGRLQLAATAEGFAGGKTDRIEIAAGAEITGVEIALDHGGSITGLLHTAPGEAAEDFTIIVQSEATQKTVPCTAAADGHFRADNLDPGRYQVQAMHPSTLRLMQQAGDVEPGRSFDLRGMMSRVTEGTVSQRCVVRAGEATAVELDASDLGNGTRLTLRVTVGGKPIDGGVVEAMLVEDGRLRIGFLDGGEATFAALRPGQLRVQVRTGMTLAPVGGPQFLEVPIGIDHHRTTIELPGGELSGRVVDQDGQPVPAALVRLLRSGGADDDLFGTAVTDTDGAFSFRALQPDSYGLVAADALQQHQEGGVASRVDGIRIADGEHRTGIELRAQPAVGATVLVTDTAGAPLAGAMLLAVDPDGRPLGNFALGVTGPDGRAHLGGLPRGPLRVAGRASGYAPDVTEVAEGLPGRPIELRLALPRGTRAVLEARGRDGLPLVGATIRARCNGGPWLPSLLLLENNGAGGRFELGRLAAGNWEFQVEHPASGPFTVSRAIGDGGTVTILATPAR